MIERFQLAGITLLIGLAFSGCHRSSATDTPVAKVVRAFDDLEGTPGNLHAIDPARFSAQMCVEGTIRGLFAVVCQFGAEEATQRGKKAVEAWVATAVTGVALVNDRTVLGLADRSRIDPLGKSIHALTKTYLAIK